MTREEQNRKLKAFITCLKCEVSCKPCDANCPVQYQAGNMGEIIENLEAISKALEQEPRKGHWIVQPSNEEQGERPFIWWKCSKCGQVIFSETEKDRKEFHAFCGRCGADMREIESEE